MPPKRSTRAAAATTTNPTTTRTRTTRADAATANPAVGGARPTTTTTTTTTKRAVAPSHKMKAPTSAAPQQLDGAADDDGADNSTEPSNGGSGGDSGGDSGGEDSDTLGISTRPARLFRRADRDTTTTAEDYVMTGALADGDGAATKNNRNVRTRGRMRGGVTKQRAAAKDPEQARALEALRKRREEAMGGGDPVAAPAAGATAGAAARQADAEREEEDTERGRRQEVPGTASRVRRASSSHWNNTMPGSAVKAQGTPATERSVLALTKFKKRRRQGSLLRMMQQSDAEDTGGDDSMDDSAATLDYSLGDFEPDHEGTPLNMGRRGSMAAALPGSEPRTSSSRKRKFAERDEMERSTVQVPRSSPPVMEEQVVADGEETSSEHLYSEASETQQMVVDTQPEPREDEDITTNKAATDTAAPHRSTSPLSSIPVEPEPEEVPAKRPRRAAARTTKSTGRTARRVSTVDPEDHAADPLSSSELESDTATETPVSMRASRKKTNSRKPKALALSTATLQSLLPRRRKKLTTRAAKTTTVGTFEIPSSSDAEEEEIEVESDDEDELQRPPAATKGRGRKNVTARTADSTVRGKKQPNTTDAAAAKKKPGKKRLSRTYGRRSSDKENQDADASIYVRSGGESDGDDIVETSEMRETKKSKELEAAARKFKEIDEWEMEFESVDMGGASASSPWR